MKQIQPITLWYNGTIIQATIFNFTGNFDNLSNTSNFTYQLFTQDNQQVASGTLIMNGQDYIDYSSSPDSNNFAYIWGANKLNLILI